MVSNRVIVWVESVHAAKSAMSDLGFKSEPLWQSCRMLGGPDVDGYLIPQYDVMPLRDVLRESGFFYDITFVRYP